MSEHIQTIKIPAIFVMAVIGMMTIPELFKHQLSYIQVCLLGIGMTIGCFVLAEHVNKRFKNIGFLVWIFGAGTLFGVFLWTTTNELIRTALTADKAYIAVSRVSPNSPYLSWLEKVSNGTLQEAEEAVAFLESKGVFLSYHNEHLFGLSAYQMVLPLKTLPLSETMQHRLNQISMNGLITRSDQEEVIKFVNALSTDNPVALTLKPALLGYSP